LSNPFKNHDLIKKISKQKILVTGGASFIGSHLVERLVGLGAEVVVIDNLSSGEEHFLSNVKDSINLVVDDVREINNYKKEFIDKDC
jgi:UDP-glucose 4-epimerase